MRDDQRERLLALSDTLTDTVIMDVDPANWTASGTALCDMTKAQRGDANWCRKTAIQSVVLLQRVEQLIGQRSARTPSDDEEIEREIKTAEKEANRMLERVLERQHAGK